MNTEVTLLTHMVSSTLYCRAVVANLTIEKSSIATHRFHILYDVSDLTCGLWD